MIPILTFGFILQYCTASSHEICCKRNVTLTVQPDTESSSCALTLNQLMDYNGTDRKENCSRKEYIFQSGSHQVYQNRSCKSLTFKNAHSVVIRAQPSTTVTLNCMNLITVDFINVSAVTIHNIHFHNCNCFAIPSQFKAITFFSSTIDIRESRFSDSGMLFQVMKDEGKTSTNIRIEDTIIEKCSITSRSIIRFQQDCRPAQSLASFNITLKNLKVVDNNQSFLELTGTNVHELWLLITFTGQNYFDRNNGSIINATFHANATVRVTFSRAEVYIRNNTASSVPIFLNRSLLVFEQCKVLFSDNRGELCGAISAYNSKIIFSDNTTIQFSNNTGLNGGALSLDSASALVFNATNSPISINFTRNMAQRGGALYVNDSATSGTSSIRSIFELQCDVSLVKLTFCNNSAELGGNQIYGGWVDWFTDETGLTRYAHNTVEKMFDFQCNNVSEIASRPIRICRCTENSPDCKTNYTMEIYGHSVTLDLVAVGQRYTPVSAYVKASLGNEPPKLASDLDSFSSDKQMLHLWPRIETLERICTKITYKMYSEQKTLYLEPDLNYCGRKNNNHFHIDRQYIANDSITGKALMLFQQFSIELKSKSCPLGFNLHQTDRNCVCQPSILLHDLGCDSANSKIIRTKNQWIGMTKEHNMNDDGHKEVIVHQPCPYDYCREDNDSLSIHLENQDVLCAFNRSGILCGHCQTNFSRVLGSSKCMKCTNNPLLLAIVLGWMVTGLLVVISLMLLDLTVSVGTINGLTFYVNIIQAQHYTFFTPQISNSFMSKFIAWVNLDQGIELCLYNGLDDYSIAWLELLYPLYIWLLAMILIVSSHYSTLVSKLTGKNGVKVLATLFLLSYTRLLRLIIDAFSFAEIIYPNGYKKKVWLSDGNVDYLSGKHVPLFLVTLLIVLLSLPYTLILLTIQFLHRISHLRAMFWVQRLKPFFDAYTGPFKPHHRYWTGLLLLARIILLSIFSINQGDDAPANLLAIIVVSFVLVSWSSCVKWVYESPLNNFLETFFLCNLGITSAAVLFDKHNATAINVSTSIAFITLVFIVLYHVQRQTKLGSKLKKKYLSAIKRKGPTNSSVPDDLHQSGVSSTTVELKEPLLEYEPEL